MRLAHSETTNLVQILNSIIVRARESTGGAKGGGKRVVRKIAWRLLTKIHLKIAFDGLPIASLSTGGEAVPIA